MTDGQARGLRFTTFPEANYNEEHVAAVLITKDEEGKHHAYVKEIPGKNPPIPEAVEMLVQAVELANL